jgi:hypothetical protein
LDDLHAMPARIRTLPARCALAAAALSIAIAISPAAALAGGPGVTVLSRQLPTPFTLAGDQFSGDVGARAFTVRDRPGTVGRKVTAGGMSIRSVLARAGVNVSSISRVAMSRGDGSDLVLTRADLENGFPEGPALISDTGGSTRVFRPVRNARDVNARDDFDSGGGPLLIRVDDATALAVQASANPTAVRTGAEVTFTAKVLSPPPGGLEYHWEFGDGSSDEGQTVRHSFDVALDKQVQVTVTGNCATFCQGLDSVTVIVGNPAKGPNAPGATNPGSGTGNPLSPGAGTGTGEGGAGGSGGGNGTGAGSAADVQATLNELARQRAAIAAKKQARKDAARKRKLDAARRRAAADRAQREVSPAEVTRPSGLTVTGILLAGQGTPLVGGLPPLPSTAGGTPKGTQAARGTSIADSPSIPASVALAIFAIGMGALRERRLVKLRIA